MVAASFLIMTTAWGANRTFGVFLEPMLDDFGWTRAGISGAFTLAMLTIGTMSLVAGNLTDRVGPRAVVVGCGFFLGCGYILVSQVKNISQFYLFYGVITGIGLSGCLVPLMSIVVRWFVKRRALMSGILVAGPALGIVIVPLVSSFFIASYGWRNSYLIMGISVVIIIVVAALFLRRDPEERGLLPYGYEKEKTCNSVTKNDGLCLSEVLRNKQFWLLNYISFGDLFLINVVVVHLVSYAVSLDIPANAAASILSVAAGVSIPGRIIVGGVADKIGNRAALMMCLFMSIVAFLLLLIAKEMWLLYLFAIIYGFGLWASGSIVSPITAELFGLKSHGTILAFNILSHTIGGAVGPLLIGHIYDVTGSYQLGFIICMAISIAGFIAITLLRPIYSE